MTISTQARAADLLETVDMTVLCAAGLTIAAAVATWWLVGDLSTPGSDVDYAFGPLTVDPTLERALGVGSIAVLVVALGLLASARWRGFLARWWSVLVPLVLVGVIVGAGLRVMTAGVIGANIGAGLVALFGGPVVVALLLWVVFRSLRLARR
jgi:hypothetical protein